MSTPCCPERIALCRWATCCKGVAQRQWRRQAGMWRRHPGGPVADSCQGRRGVWRARRGGGPSPRRQGVAEVATAAVPQAATAVAGATSRTEFEGLC